MKAIEAMICWNPETDEVDVLPWPDTAGRSDKYDFTDGACCLDWRKADDLTREMLVFIEFNTLVVRDGVNPKAAHRAFLKIDEYRRRISPDMEGAAMGEPA